MDFFYNDGIKVFRYEQRAAKDPKYKQFLLMLKSLISKLGLPHGADM